MKAALADLRSAATLTPSSLTVLPAWQLSDLTGRLVEVSGQRSTAHLTAAFGLVLEAQLCGDRAAWVTLAHSAFFPPDVADGGIDVDVAAGGARARPRPPPGARPIISCAPAASVSW